MLWPLSWRIGNRLESSATVHCLSADRVIGTCGVRDPPYVKIRQMRDDWSDCLVSFKNIHPLRNLVTPLPCFNRRNLNYSR